MLHDFCIADPDYADDVAVFTVFTSSQTHLINALNMFTEKASKLGLQVNWIKTNVMEVANGPLPLPMVTDGQEVKLINSSEYLGSIIPKEGGCFADMKH